MDWLGYLREQSEELADRHRESRRQLAWESPRLTLARQEAVLARLLALQWSWAIHLERRN
jgi:hypothetical protein